MRNAFRPEVSRLLTQFFNEQEAVAVSAIKFKWGDGLVSRTSHAVWMETKFSLSDWLSGFARSFWNNRFLDLLIGSIRNILKEGMLAGMLRAGIGELTQEQLDARNVQLDIVARQVARSELVNDTTERELIEMLIRMIDENATQQDMQVAMREKFEGYRSYRVDRITNTVVVGAFESGTLLSWQEAGIDSKGWLDGKDARVRPTHVAARGQIVPLEAPFTVGNAQLMHPGDPNGPVGEVINCRCTMVPVFEGDEDLAREAINLERV